MIRPCFSTVACPDWTLERVCAFAAEQGFAGVELRTQGTGSTDFANDPALTDGAKVRELLSDAALGCPALASGIALDRPIQPPVLGRLLPGASIDVRNGRSLVDLARGCGAESVRVFGFRVGEREKRSTAILRIAGRLAQIVDHARHKGAAIVLENGGGFARAADIAEFASLVNRPELRFAYDIAAGVQAGDDPAEAVRLLGRSLHLVRVRELDEGGLPVALGRGVTPVRQTLEALSGMGSRVWVSFTWDRAWIDDLAPADAVLPGVAERLYELAGAEAGSSAAA